MLQFSDFFFLYCKVLFFIVGGGIIIFGAFFSYCSVLFTYSSMISSNSSPLPFFMALAQILASFLIFSSSAFSSSSEITICWPLSPPKVYISLISSVLMLSPNDFLPFFLGNSSFGSTSLAKGIILTSSSSMFSYFLKSKEFRLRPLSSFDLLTKLKSNFLLPLSLLRKVGATGPTSLYSYSCSCYIYMWSKFLPDFFWIMLLSYDSFWAFVYSLESILSSLSYSCSIFLEVLDLTGDSPPAFLS